jgi:hypothetical protein
MHYFFILIWCNKISYGLGINEHHCRRLLSLRRLQKIHHNMVPIAASKKALEKREAALQRFIGE